MAKLEIRDKRFGETMTIYGAGGINPDIYHRGAGPCYVVETSAGFLAAQNRRTTARVAMLETLGGRKAFVIEVIETSRHQGEMREERVAGAYTDLGEARAEADKIVGRSERPCYGDPVVTFPAH